MWETLKRDPIVRLFFFAILLISLPYLVPGLLPFREYAHQYGELGLYVLIILAFQYRLRVLETGRERAFWHYLSVAVVLWIIARLIRILVPDVSIGSGLVILWTSLYLLYYLCFIIAVESRPDVAVFKQSDDPATRIRFAGFVVFLLSLLVYFALIPGSLAPSVYEAFLPSYFFFAALDCILTVRFFQLFRMSRTDKWRNIFGFIGFATLCFTFLDILEWLSYAGSLEMPWGTYFDFLWDLPLLALIAAARVRHHAFPRSQEHVVEEVQQLRSPLILFAFSIPAIHFVLSRLEALDPVARDSQEVAAFFCMVLLGTMAVFENLFLRRTANRLESEKRLAAREMEHSLSLLRATLESTADGILVVDTGGKIISFNQEFLSMWRIPESVIETRNDDLALSFVLDQLTFPDAFLAKVRELYSDPDAESYDVLEFKDGRIFERYSRPQRIGKQSAGRVWSFRDVSEQRRAEKALRASEEKYRNLFEESHDVVFVVSQDGKILDINPAGVRAFGFDSREEMMSLESVQKLYVEPGKREEYRKIMEQQGYVKDFEIQMRTAKGEIRSFLESSTVMLNDRGEILGYRGLMRDVTHLQQLQEQLLQSQKMEIIGRLAGGVAHDFNNILMAIFGFAELIHMKTQRGEPCQEHVMDILKSADRGAALTRQLLAFGRKQVLNPKVLNLNQIVAGMENMLQRLLGEDIELVLHLEPELWPVRVDPVQMEQVILNLAVNARDAMPEGGTLTLETDSIVIDTDSRAQFGDVGAGWCITLSVLDTGVGMSEETRSRIFDPFFTTKDFGKGTGLGLSSSYGIIKQSSGHISVNSELGRGSCFTIYLPAHVNELVK